MKHILEMIDLLVSEHESRINLNTRQSTANNKWHVKLRDEHAPNAPLFDVNGHAELAATGDTLEEAIANLDAICATPYNGEES